MTAVPQRVLNWLYSVLTREYLDVNRTYSDTAQALSSYSSLSPRTEVYTYENGSSALLLHILGTIPVTFRGATYRFPISLWVPHGYPREAPMVYVTPTSDMVIRPGQHVSGEGRVYHPYLSGWAEFWDKSTILDFLAILRDVFAKEPPVRSRQQEAPARLEPTSTPPPVPPLPAELGLSSSQPVQPAPAPAPTFIPPPPPPPKPFESPRTSSHINFDKYAGPPLVPPLPGRQSSRPTPPSQFQNNFTSEHHPPNYSQSYGAGSNYGGTQPVLPTAQQNNRGANSYIPTSPVVSAESWDRQPALTAQQQVQQQSLAYQEKVPRSSASGLPPNLPQQPQAQFGAPTSWPPRSPQQGQYPTTEPQPLPKEQPRPAPDLLTSTGELLALPPSNAEMPLPPVPPNPEKDSLLQSIGVALYQKRQASAAHTEASVASLSAQYGALKAASSRLQAEEDALKSLSSTLTSNEKILKESMRKAEEVMNDAKTRTVPGVDEILVAPTVVAGQLYELVAEERAINDALFVLSRAHDNRRITSDLFLRDTRTLARERFLKKALIKKIANGLGLEGAHI